MPKPIPPHSGEIVTRAEAKASGAKFYFTGKPCSRGHVDQREVGWKKCVACNAEKQAERRARDPEATLAKHKALWEKLKDDSDYLAYRDAYRLENGDILRATAAAWRITNPEKYRANQTNRYALVRGAEGKHTAVEVVALLKRQKGKCAYCKRSIVANYHKDHIQPLSKGGSNWIRNIQLLCPPCNHRKSAKDPVAFARQNGLLI